MIISFYPGGGGNRYLRFLADLDWENLNCSYDNTNYNQMFEHRYLLENTNTGVTGSTILTHCINKNKIQQVFSDSALVFIKTDLQSSLRREWILHGHKRFIEKNTISQLDKLEHYYAIKDPLWPQINNIDDLQKLPEYILEEVDARYKFVVDPHKIVTGPLTSLTTQLLDKINSSYEIINWHLKYYRDWPLQYSSNDQIIDVDNDDSEFCELMRRELSLYQSEIFDEVWNTSFLHFNSTEKSS
jgi:hypothetical protein